ncbi:MAG: hypothetical protein ACI959_001763 [Limisphaerales bacterium]|jgi:hypothetical protein
MEGSVLFMAFVYCGECIHLYFCRSDAIGDAMAKIYTAAKLDGLKPLIINVDPINPDSMTYEVIPDSSADLFRAVKRFRVEVSTAIMQLPYGVISSSEHEHPQNFKEGFELNIEKQDFYSITIQVDDNKLLETFILLSAHLDHFSALHYTLHEADRRNVLMLASHGQWDGKALAKHLTDRINDSVKHGYVSFMAFHPEGKTNLTLSDNKLIYVKTRSESICLSILDCLENAGLEMRESLYSICDIAHWHYSHPDSLPVDELMIDLMDQGFEEWEI